MRKLKDSGNCGQITIFRKFFTNANLIAFCLNKLCCWIRCIYYRVDLKGYYFLLFHDEKKLSLPGKQIILFHS